MYSMQYGTNIVANLQKLTELRRHKYGWNPDKCYLRVQIITHNDLDGYASAAVVYWTLLKANIITPGTCIIQYCSYSKDKLPTFYSNIDVYIITDYSITNEDFATEFEAMVKEHDYHDKTFIWCDHHKSSIDLCNTKYPYLHDVRGIRDSGYCGAYLAWACLHPNKSVPGVIKLVDDYDFWKLKKKDSMYLNHAFYNSSKYSDDLHNPKSKLWKHLLSCGIFARPLIKYGKDFDAKIRDYHKNNLLHYGFIGKLNIHGTPNPGEMLFLNSVTHSSIVFGEYLEKYQHVCVYDYDGKYYHVSIYTTPGAKPTARQICEAYGGGGHDNAAGFTTTEPFMTFVRKLND